MRYRFILRRVAAAAPLLFGVTLLSFLIIHAVPGDPARAMAGGRASSEQIEAIRSEMGLDDPIHVQYVQFVGRALQGDLGESNRSGVPVTEILARRLPVTAWIVGLAAVMSLVVAVPLAWMSAARKDRFADHAARFVTTIGLGLPVFWVGIMLIVLVALPTGWFPVGGEFGDSVLDHLRATTLPAVALTLGLTPLIMRSLRSGMINVLGSEHVASARSVGISGWPLLSRYVARNSMVPVVSVAAVAISYLTVGSTLIERTFNLPGIGDSLVSAASNRDYPVIVGTTLLFGVLVLVVNLVADIALAVIDPRISIQ
jgi:peptide/nickel transport system permease protein